MNPIDIRSRRTGLVWLAVSSVAIISIACSRRHPELAPTSPPERPAITPPAASDTSPPSGAAPSSASPPAPTVPPDPLVPQPPAMPKKTNAPSSDDVTPSTSGAQLEAAPVAQSSSATLTSEKVDENSLTAKALNYRQDASEVKDPKRTTVQVCAACQMYSADKEVERFAPCGNFQGKQVAASGWCSAWVKKA